MFCKNCGNELEKETMVCSHCGATQNEPVPEQDREKRFKKKWFKFRVIFTAILMLIVFAIAMNDSEKEADALEVNALLEKLETFTSTYGDDSCFYFVSNSENWELTYSNQNEFVYFENEGVVACFTDVLGEDCFAEDSASTGGFIYDLSDDKARVYFDIDMLDGHLSIVNYYVSKNKYEVMVDGEKWSMDDALEEELEGLGLSEIIKSDVEQFMDSLAQNDIKKKDLFLLDFKMLDTMYEDVDDTADDKKTTGEDVSISNKNNVPKVTFSASIGEINGTVYCARQVYGEDEFGMYEAKTVPTCKLLPVETYELGVVSSFCYYDGYVYYIVSEEGSSDYSSWLYRCKPNWTGTELLDEIICTQYPFQMGERFFVIDNGVLYYRNYDAQNPPTAIHLETQTKYNSMPPKYMVDGEKRTYDVEIYNDIMFFTEDNIVYKIENGKKILLATNAYLDGGCTSDFFYYSEMDNIGYMVFLYRIPINGGEKELIDSKILMGGGGPYFSW